MVCPDGRVNRSDQPLVGAVPVLAIVMVAVSPMFHGLTV
jgi:hypothetical protein